MSLDVDDNDPRRLWSAVVAALLALPRSGGDPRAAAASPDGRAARGTATSSTSSPTRSTTSTSPVRLVLDDVHELTEPEVLRDLARLIRRPPSGLHLVLASRSDPPISLPRLRLEGRLHELRADDLRFTLGRHHRPAEGQRCSSSRPAQVGLLHARTEGWAAGLRLAALALRRSDDPDRFPDAASPATSAPSPTT